MFSKESDCWGTPDEFFKRCDAEYHFTLDAAADESNHKCDRWLGPGGEFPDALSLDWPGERVWLNPPYSMATEFLAHAVKQSNEHEVGSVILLPSRTDTKWFHNFVWYSAYQKPHPWVKSMNFIKGRLKFVNHAEPSNTNSASFPSLLVVLRGDWSR
jgi:phage N-6-adenine-methyltransferase